MQQPRDSSAAASPAPRPCHSQGNACHGGAQACSRARPLSPRPQAKAPSLCLPALSWARTRRAGRLWERASSQKSSFRAAAASCPRAGSQPPDSQKPLAEEPPAALPRSRGHREQERSRVAWPGGLRGGSPAPSSALPAAPVLPQAWRCGDAAVLTMERASRVCWSSGSGSREMCTHSGTFTVPPSRSAITTSSCRGGTGMRGGHGELTGKEPGRGETLGNPSSSPLHFLQAQSTLAFSSNFPLPRKQGASWV